MSTFLLADAIERRARLDPERDACLFIDGSGTEVERLNYGTLDRRARCVAAMLNDLGAVGERVLLVFPPGLTYVVAVVACLYSGAIATPIPLPRGRGRSRAAGIIEDSQPILILTNRKERDRVEAAVFPSGALRVECVDDWMETAGEVHPRSVVCSETIALLQYTSGSTADPRGVVVTHGHLTANVAMLRERFPLPDPFTLVSWLPHYHDMGLIGSILYPLSLGARTVLMSPAAFLRRPLAWLEAISKYGAAAAVAPNFGYELCAERVAAVDIRGLDLRSWQVALNAAEPIREATIRRFSERFMPCGFRPESFVPAYGLAEATLFVSGGPAGAPPNYRVVGAEALEQHMVMPASGMQNRVTLVSCGAVATGLEVVIVDPHAGTVCPDGRVGEIWCAGASVASGYWGRRGEDDSRFGASLAGHDGKSFVRTGDLGFVDCGELFVTGRIKDLILIRGRNLYPQDVEQVAIEVAPALRGHGAIAFTVEEGGEDALVVALEVDRKSEPLLTEIAQRIREAVVGEFGINIATIVFVRAHSLPRTSSGKLRRSTCRSGFLSNDLDVVTQWCAAASPAGHPSAVAVPGDATPSATCTDLIAWLRTYAEERINSTVMDDRRSISPHVVLDFGNRGLLGLQAPIREGGLALNYTDTVTVLQQLGAIDITLAAFVGVQNALGLPPILRYASPRIRQEYLPLLASGRALAAFAVTEPAAGSNPYAMRSTAVPDGSGGWRLYGEKSWVGSGSWATIISVFVQEVDGEGKHRHITGFALRQGQHGLRQGSEALTMGMRGMVQNTVFMDGVVVGPDDLLGRPGQGMEVAQESMMLGRLGIAAMSIGAMKRCAQLMVRYAGRRTIGTGCLLDNAVTMKRLGDLTSATSCVEALVARIAALLDAGAAVPIEAYLIAKITGSELLWRAADHLMQLLGGRGYIESNFAPQIMRDARLLRIFEGPTEVLLHHLGHAALAGSSTLNSLLSRELGAPVIASRFEQACLKARKRLRRMRASADLTAIAALRTGELAAYAAMLAAITAQRGGRPDADGVDRSLAWIEREYASMAQALMAIDSTSVEDRDEVIRTIGRYRDDIGWIEQQLPGEQTAVDPMLRRDDYVVRDAPARPIMHEAALDIPKRLEFERWIRNWMVDKLGLDADSIDVHRSFAYHALDSLRSVDFIVDLEAAFDMSIAPGQVLDNPSIDAFLDFLTHEWSAQAVFGASPSGHESDDGSESYEL